MHPRIMHEQQQPWFELSLGVFLHACKCLGIVLKFVLHIAFSLRAVPTSVPTHPHTVFKSLRKYVHTSEMT